MLTSVHTYLPYDYSCPDYLFFFFFLHPFFLEVAGAAAPELAATSLNPPTQTAFCLAKVPNRSKQNPRYILAILFVVVQLASSHSLQHIKFAREAIREAFCLHGQTI